MAMWALFFHILGALLLFSGIVLAATGFELARRRDRPSTVALLLHVSRIGAVLASIGAVTVLGFGLWMIELRGHRVGEPWIITALVLLALATTAGIAGGQRPKAARRLASALARRDDTASPELDRALSDRTSILLNYLAALLIVVILLLMVFKPGS